MMLSTFREWSTSPGVLLTLAERDALQSWFQARVTPSPGTTDRYDVTPGNVVGCLQVAGSTITVVPKIGINNVLFLIGYSVDPVGWEDDAASLATATELTSGVADLLALLVAKALERGILRGYRLERDSSPTVRGRIDFALQLKVRPGQALPIALEYQEYDEDILENQLLVAGLEIASFIPDLTPSTRRVLDRSREALQLVSRCHFQAQRVPSVRWTRLNAHYREAVELARWLIELQSLDVGPGARSARGLRVDMADVYERFVRTALRHKLGASAHQFPSGKEVRGLFLDSRGHIHLDPDLSYWVGARCCWIGDVKYKRDAGAGKADDRYQLLAYAVATGLPRATAIYGEGPTQGEVHYIPGAGTELAIRSLDLQLPPKDLLASLDPLVAEIKASAMPAAGGVRLRTA